MFCENCGKKMEKDSLFCDSCGNKVGEVATKSKEKVKDDTVVIEIKPTFKFVYFSLRYIFTFLIFILPLLIIMNIDGVSSEIGKEGGYIAAGIAGIYVLSWILHALITKLQYNKFVYKFYNTKVVYRDSFLNISEKEVKYSNIKETTYMQRVIERIFKLGTITLFTNAESGYSNGIIIHSVHNTKEQYDKVKELINQ